MANNNYSTWTYEKLLHEYHNISNRIPRSKSDERQAKLKSRLEEVASAIEKHLDKQIFFSNENYGRLKKQRESAQHNEKISIQDLW